MDFNYLISELEAMRANVERLIREADEARKEQIARPPQTQAQPHPPAPKPEEIRDPLAKSMGDLVTPRQLGMIRALAREAGLDPDEECQSVFRCKAEELGKRAASSFIEHLQKCKAEFEQAKRAS